MIQLSTTLHSAPAATHRWGVVLAGGEGSRMRSFVRDWMDEDRPKQYCAFSGSRSMLQHVIERAGRATHPDQTLTVIGNGHQRYLEDTPSSNLNGMYIEQPADRGSGAGVFLAAARIVDIDPLAVMLILPADQFIYPEERFAELADHACAVAEETEDIVLLGATADRPETDFGWIEPGEALESVRFHNRPAIRRVRAFHEKPSLVQAHRLLRRGCFWNTMTLAVRARVLWEIGRKFVPDMVYRFETYRHVLSAVREGLVDSSHAGLALNHIYLGMDEVDFSECILERVAARTRVLPLEGVDWSDWGRPSRVVETINRLGLRPAFPARLLHERKHVAA